MGLFVEKTLTNSHQPDSALISEHDTKYFLEAKYFLETKYFLGLSTATHKVIQFTQCYIQTVCSGLYKQTDQALNQFERNDNVCYKLNYKIFDVMISSNGEIIRNVTEILVSN